MKKEQLPEYLVVALEGAALPVFLQATDVAARQGKSQAGQYAAAFAALQKAGFCKSNGKWKQDSGLVVKMQKAQRMDEDKRQVFGFFSVVELNGQPIVDSQGDIIKSEDIESAVYKYVKLSRMGDERHDSRAKMVCIESMYFSKEKQQALGIDLGYVGWWGGFEVQDAGTWAKIKSGEYQGFSIGGVGRREQI